MNPKSSAISAGCILALALTPLVAFAAGGDPEILGYLEPYKTISVSAGEQGIIAEMHVEEGARVSTGQILAQLDTAALQADLEISRAEAKLQATRLKRLQELAASSRSTPEELD